MLTPDGEFFSTIKHIPNYKRHEQTNGNKKADQVRLNDIRLYSYHQLVIEYENTHDKGTSRFLRMEAKKDPKYNADDFIRKRNKYEEVDINETLDDDEYYEFIQHISEHGNDEIKKKAIDILKRSKMGGKGDFTLPNFTPKHLKDND